MKWIFTKITAKKAFKIFGVVYIGAIVLLNCVAVGNLIASPSAFTAIFAAGSVFAALLAWLVVRVVLPHILRARDRQLEFIREHGGPRHALKSFLFGAPGNGQSKQS